MVRSYLALDPTAGALGAGAEALAGAVTSYAVRMKALLFGFVYYSLGVVTSALAIPGSTYSASAWEKRKTGPCGGICICILGFGD